MPPNPRSILAMPPFLLIFFIIFCMRLNCFNKRFTSCICVPEPAAMRFFLEPLMTAGNRRSPGRHGINNRLCFQELAILDLGYRAGRQLLHSRQLAEHSRQAAHVLHLSDLIAKSSRSNPFPFLIFLAIFSAFFRSAFSSTSSIRLNTSPMPKMREAILSG